MQGGQPRGPINGLDPSIYTGGLPNLVVMDREPTPRDFFEFVLGHWWIVPVEYSDTGSGEVWVLVSKRFGIATWKRLHGGSSPGNNFVVGNQYFTTPGTGTYTPTVGMLQCYVEVVGGGGGGYGGKNAAANSVGGGGGGYAAKLYTAAQIGTSQTFFIGSGGTAVAYGSNPPGNNGQDSTFGSGSTLITAGGGKSAVVAGIVGGTYYINSPGGIASGGNININGGASAVQGANLATIPLPGGSSLYGFGGIFTNNADGSISAGNGQLYGGGGGLGGSTFSPGNGAQGVIKITEYFA